MQLRNILIQYFYTIINTVLQHFCITHFMLHEFAMWLQKLTMDNFLKVVILDLVATRFKLLLIFMSLNKTLDIYLSIALDPIKIK